LLIAVASQMWFGVLLLYDTAAGPITKFRVSDSSVPTTQNAKQ